MPKPKQRKTGWQPQSQRRLRIRGVRWDTPDAKKISRAFINLALARAEAETLARAEAEGPARNNTSIVHPADADADSAENAENSDVPR